VRIFITSQFKQVSYIQLSRSLLTSLLALKAIKASLRENQAEYQHQHEEAALPLDRDERDVYFKTRSLAVLFKLRRLPRDELKRECIHLGIPWRELTMDMPVRWNSTDRMNKAMLHLERPIRAVLLRQD
jgi:hypothetical protein